MKSPGTVTAYDQNNLLITLLVERDQMNIDSNTVNMTAYNNGSVTINEFLFQAAVPKVSYLKIIVVKDILQTYYLNTNTKI